MSANYSLKISQHRLCAERSSRVCPHLEMPLSQTPGPQHDFPPKLEANTANGVLHCPKQKFIKFSNEINVDCVPLKIHMVKS